MTAPRITLDSWRRAHDIVIYILAALFLAGAVTSIWVGDWRYVGIGGAVVFVMAWVIALTEERRTTP